MDTLALDLRHALRMLRKQPGFSAIAIAILALGIGASTAVFTLVDSVLLRPLGYSHPESLAILWEVTPSGREENFISPINFFAWQEQAKSFADMGAWFDRPLNVAVRGQTHQVVTRLSTANYFSILGVPAALGSTFVPATEGADAAVISHRLWQRHFAGDPKVIGETISVNDSPVTIIGVMPARFQSVAGQPDLWFPYEFSPEARGRFLTGVARLRPGVTVEEAQAEMTTIGRRLAEEFPERNKGMGINVVGVHDQITKSARPTLLLLLGAVGLLLLLACANVANLMIGRAASRRKEIAVRLSLGATRGRLIRRTLAESLFLGILGGGIGVALAYGATFAVVTFLPKELALPRIDEISIDARVLGFAVAASILTAVLFGIAPALSGSAVRPSEALRDSSRGTTAGRSRLRGTLVVVEVAVAVVLLVGAGLLGRTLDRLISVDVGLQAENVLTMRVAIAGEKYQEGVAFANFATQLMARLEAIPGARAVGAIVYLPLTGEKIGHSFWIEDRPRPEEGDEPGMDLRPVAGDYFAAMGVPIRRGRSFTERDDRDAPLVFVVNEEFVRRYFPDRDPIGRRVAFEWGATMSGEIVGIAGNVREMGPTESASPAIYIPYVHLTQGQLNLVVRAAGEPRRLASAVEAAVKEVDPTQPVADVRTMEQVAAATVARPRVTLYLIGGFAAMALLLAALGLYAIIAWSVTQRRQEIGVRVALGAQRGDVLRLVIRQAARLTALGLLAGLAIAIASTRFLEALLFEVSRTDPLTFVAVAVFLSIVALAASLVPALRATQVEASSVLRSE